MKRILKDYFSFSKKERTAVIILLLLAALFTALPHFFPAKNEIPAIDAAAAVFIKGDKRSPYRHNKSTTDQYDDSSAVTARPAVLFHFDPNTLPVEGWTRLGVKPKTAATIINYRNKGGRFRSAQDLHKIWGLPDTLAEKLIPYAVITLLRKEFQRNGQRVNHFNTSPVVLDINTATPAEWKALPGMGDVLSNRIVNYRERAGGFSGVAQLKKVYGISDSVFTLILPFLRADPGNLPKLDLNTVNQYLLAERTGITQNVAKGIIIYRQQYGRFKAVEDLHAIVFISDSLYRLLQPHVTVKVVENGP